MKWYPYLYVSESAKAKEKKIIRKLKMGAGMIDVWVITRAANGTDVFDILSSKWLQQKAVRRNLPEIIGIARGYDEAVALVMQILEETREQTGSADIKKYLEEKKKLAGAGI